MHCVLDCSFTATLFLPDEMNEKSMSIAAEIARQGAAVPAVWQMEMANLLLMAERRKRITSAMHTQVLEALWALPIAHQSNLNRGQLGDVIQLARRYSLTAYDTAYLELSIRLNLPLATLDHPLRNAAKAEGVNLLP